MKRIRLMPEYMCYPLWIYDEENDLMTNGLPKELENDKEIESELAELQERYDDLYINNPIEFAFRGFESEKEYNEFNRLLDSVFVKLKEKLSSRYVIEKYENLFDSNTAIQR